MKHQKRRKYLKNGNNINYNDQLLPLKRNITDNLDDVHYIFYQYMNENYLKQSEDDLNFKIYKEVMIKIISQLKRQNTQERKHLFRF